MHRRRGRTVGVCACVILGLFVWLYQEEVVALFSREDAGDELKLPDNTRAAARRHGPEDKPGRAAQGGAGQDPDSSLPQSDETNAGAGKGSADPEPRDQLDSLDPRSLLKAAEEAAEAADQEYQRRPGDGSSAAGSGTGAGVGAGIGAHGGVRVETGNLEDIMRQRLREKLRGQEQGQGQGLGRGRDVRADVIKLLRAQREAAAERLQGLREGADQEAAGAAAAVDKDPVAARPGFAEAWGEREKAKSTDEATCEQLLDSKDEVFYSRDFQAEPIRVHSSQVCIRRAPSMPCTVQCVVYLYGRGVQCTFHGPWAPRKAGQSIQMHCVLGACAAVLLQVMRWTCDVPCVFANDDSLTYDGGLGTGKGTYNIIRSMEAASYYGNNDVNKARGAGFDVRTPLPLPPKTNKGYLTCSLPLPLPSSSFWTCGGGGNVREAGVGRSIELPCSSCKRQGTVLFLEFDSPSRHTSICLHCTAVRIMTTLHFLLCLHCTGLVRR